MSRILAAALLTIILGIPDVFALPPTFTPALPDSDDLIEIRFTGVCPVFCSVARATPSIAGRVITISVTLQGSVLQVVTAWEGSVRVGPLAPGSYTVRFVSDSTQSTLIDDRTLIVTESDPAFRVSPFSARGGETITLISARPDVGLATCTAAACTPAEVRINGTAASEARSTRFDIVHVRVPDLPDGLYDVTASIAGRERRAVAAIRVVEDVAPDDPLFERILVPTALRGRGAFGSEWRTDVFVRNAGLPSIPLLGIGDVEGGATSNVADRLPNDDRGVFLRVDRPSAPPAALAAFVRDISRDGARWGVELPLVREQQLRRGEINFAAVPLDRNARGTLRLYALDITNGTYIVVITDAQNVTLIFRDVVAIAPDRARPAYAALGLTSLGIPDQTVSIRIYPASNSEEGKFARFWSFVTVTNNETQHVTIISPQ
ncbi:MAG TPA: hypothetical protein VGK04_11900 [Thermoanaerobaculia bacterium]|jgi:hypothetical protein